jgi:hypothetical protein
MQTAWIVFSAVLLMCFVSTPGHADNPVITKTGPNTEVVRINRPVVTQRETNYPTVVFLPGDKVSVTAGGCVQTGGRGSTWKRYVNPSGDDSDRLYHGRIEIPTATAGLETIQSIIARSPVTVSTPPAGTIASQLFLRLGYDDGDGHYGDNGYYSHDNGTQNQCLNVGDAWIQLTITHASQNTPPPQAKAPMDLWWSAVDDNLLPLNPVWGMQVNADGTPNGRVPDAGQLCNNFHDENDNLQLGNPACTTQRPTVDEPNGWDDPVFWAVCQSPPWSMPGTVHGHINWGLATYTGQLFFTDHSIPVPISDGDDDYDMTLRRPDQTSATAGNDPFSAQDSRRSLGLEFDSDETIDHFKSGWWNDFHTAVDSAVIDTFTAAKGMIDNANAIVIGVIGIDNKHGTHAELHPVLGLMARVPNRSTATSDFWVFFARSRGDEGGCSQDLHDFSSTSSMQFLLPIAAAQNPQVVASSVQTSFGGAGTWSATPLPDGLLVTVNFPPALQTPLFTISPVIYGELTINHASQGAQQVFAPVRSLATPAPITASRFRAIQRPGTSTALSGGRVSPATVPSGNVPPSPPDSGAASAERDDYLGSIKAQLTPAEWTKFQNAYQHPPQAPRTVTQKFYSSRVSLERSPSSFAQFPAANTSGSVVGSPSPLKQTSTPGPNRHRLLNSTEPRVLNAGARETNAEQLLEHQAIANALQAAVGQARAQKMLGAPAGQRPTAAADYWAMPAPGAGQAK